jgi:hypothetical protein
MGYLTVDGIYCGGSVLFGTAVPETMREDGVYDGNMLRPFMFSSVKLTGKISARFSTRFC